MLITKEFTFDSAHKLIDYNGLCSNLHGHTYKLQVTLKGKIKDNGMIVDFKILNEVITNEIIKNLDHKFLNDVEGLNQPTAENMVVWIWNKLITHFEDEIFEIKLWETPTSFVTYNGD